jgi:lambda repressor-like predicted transcriptional regulator
MIPFTVDGKEFRSKSMAGFYLVKTKNYSIREASTKVGVKYETLYQMFIKDKIRDKQIPKRIIKWHRHGWNNRLIADKIGIDIREVRKYI